MHRRELIAWVAAGLVTGTNAQAARPERMKPQIGDVLVHAFDEQAGRPVRPEEVSDALLFAFPRSEDGVVRDGSLHNQVSLIRGDQTAMSEKTRQYAAGPIIAVSAACTHTGCEVSGWQAETFELVCPCHGSRFDVHEAARVVDGPATKPLALLPIELSDGVLKVTGKFSRRVGPEPTF